MTNLLINKPTSPELLSRLDQHTYFMEMAWLVSQRSTCISRRVGCVLVNQRNHVMATGYNGPPAKFPHCTSGSCPRKNKGSGQNLDQCLAVHGEVNAVLQCVNPFEISIVYLTHSPCLVCTCVLLNTSAKIIIFDEEYPSPHSKETWEKRNRLWMNFDALSKTPIQTQIRLDITE